MKIKNKAKKNLYLITAIASTFLVTTSTIVNAEESLLDALTSGKANYSARFRYENVDQEGKPREANAYTSRLTASYKTGTYYGFGFMGEIESVNRVFSDNYATYLDDPDGATYPAIADPDGTELNQGYLFYTGIPDTGVKVGRQILTYRDAPFQRYVGAAGWRQNWQTLEAASITNTSIEDTTISYAYVWGVNRVFGEDAPEPLDQFDSESHLLNYQYEGLNDTKLEAYAYLFDFTNEVAFSTDTYGLRASGTLSINESTKAIYTAEYATQSDSGDNPNSVDADYFLGEIGTKMTFDGPLKMLLVKASYELQGGNGGADRFVTILGGNHAYQGWADQFSVTPGDGVEDIYLTTVAKAFGMEFEAAYHEFSSDNNSYDYGTEFDILATKKIGKNYKVGAKYADYQADGNSMNIGSTAMDTTKFWVFVSAKF